MGKLTYINRKIDGSKLSQVVVRDITKRLPPSTSYKAAIRDPSIEFDISNKNVEVDGLVDISMALIDAIKHDENGRILILEEVSLKGNKITPQVFWAFSRVIKISASELRNLDLSDNSIEIKDSHDAEAWEGFLRSFSHCTALRRIDLSGNRLGRKGFEILSKVYAAEEGVTICHETGEAATSGLQSIPYLILANTGLDDLGATYLSYILESHRYVSDLLRLVPQAKPGPQTLQLEVYDQIGECNGVIWMPNPDVHTAGLKVLEYAETVRKARHALQDQDTVGTQLTQYISDLDISGTTSSSNRSRRDSTLDIDDESFHISSSNITSDLVRARSRIYLNVLKNTGIQHNDLWIKSLRMLNLTRIVLFGFELFSESRLLKENSNATQYGRAQAWPSLPKKTPSPQKKSGILRLTRPGAQSKVVFGQGNPNALLSLKDAANKSRGILEPKPFNGVYDRKSEKSVNIAELLSQGTKKQYTRAYRSNLPSGFSEDAWKRILSKAADADHVLSENQKTGVVKWGASRGSITELRMLKGKHESLQIYKALEGMGCLAYGI